MRGRLTHSRELQRALAKPCQLHPLCAATGKEEGEASCAPSPVWCLREDVVCVAPGRAGKELCPCPALGAAPSGGFLHRFFPLRLT